MNSIRASKISDESIAEYLPIIQKFASTLLHICSRVRQEAQKPEADAEICVCEIELKAALNVFMEAFIWPPHAVYDGMLDDIDVCLSNVLSYANKCNLESVEHQIHRALDLVRYPKLQSAATEAHKDAER